MNGFVIRYGVLTAYTGKDENVVIPEGVTSIGEEVFMWRKNLQSVVIPEGVTEIGHRAFWDCCNLQNITFPESLIKIGTSAFGCCNKLEKIIVPENVKEIAADAFCHCSNLTEVILHNNVLNIGAGTFGKCTNIKSFTIPENINEIGKHVFSECTGLYIISSEKTKRLLNCDTFFNCCSAVLIKSEKSIGLFAYSSNKLSDNFTDFVKTSKWNSYDIDLLNNGPCYKYKLPARLLGALGRLNDPVDLTDECKELYVELLVKNAKKLIPIAEEIDCPEIIEMMIKHEIINDGNKKAINKLLKASANEKIAAFAE